MIYGVPSKGEDGLYHVHAFNDDRKRCFTRLNNVKVVEITDDDIMFDINGSDAIEALHDTNMQSAVENSETWFGKKLSDKTIRTSYIRDETITADRIEHTKIFRSDKVIADKDALQVGENCSVILEFHGLWFAKKAFGPAWNVVQVKLDKDEPEEVQETFDETYPEDYMFEDDQ
jgi:hypothetical protein|tara:strand:+ start:2765 stop:3286 length:522 start_codon:yes stop_codon:yes gene_type:complete